MLPPARPLPAADVARHPGGGGGPDAATATLCIYPGCAPTCSVLRLQPDVHIHVLIHIHAHIHIPCSRACCMSMATPTSVSCIQTAADLVMPLWREGGTAMDAAEMLIAESARRWKVRAA